MTLPVGPIAFVVYPGMTLLDLVGPLQTLCAARDVGAVGEVVVVAASLEVVETDTPLAVRADRHFDDVPDPAVLVVPGGGVPTLRAMTDPALIGYLARAGARAQRVCSVCTGSLLLGAAGLLDGRRATTHWAFRHVLPRLGAVPAKGRWVEDGPVLTAAGVSAGIDMALHLVGSLAGEGAARAVQFGIEYDPEPPLGALPWDTAPRDELAPAVEQALAAGWSDLPADHPWRQPASGVAPTPIPGACLCASRPSSSCSPPPSSA